MFEEMKCLFSIAPEARKGGESLECFSLKNSNWTRSRVDLHVRLVQTAGRDARVKVADLRVRSLAEPELPVTHPVGSACLSADQLPWRVGSCSVARGALWIPIGHRVQRIRSNSVTRPVDEIALWTLTGL
jgi:hypothetical protein